VNRNPLETRVVVTGLGTINPLGNSVAEFWKNLVAGKSGIRLSRKVDLSEYHVKIAGEVDLPEDLTEYFASKKMIKRLDDYIVYAHIAAVQALKDSGLEVDKTPERYGTLIGSGDGGLKTQMENIDRLITTGMGSTSPFYVISAIPNTGSAFFAQEKNLQGPSFSVNSACATANHAIGLAAGMIKMGMADAMFAGGSEAAVNQAGISGFGNIMALSDRNDSPETASRPFDKDRNGFVLSEGAGVILVEELEHALKRNAHIYAEIVGYGFTTDAHDLVAPHPEARNASIAMKIAMETAGITPEQIGLINAHGTSTPVGDRIESVAINRAFGEYGKKVQVHSTKSMTGHLLGGASGIEAIALMLAFERNVAHPSINVFEQDPEILLNIITEPRDTPKLTHLMSNAFGFGGHNACIIFSRFEG
jgi:3-oxoacyl-[acyl-carrier-protein] synthase II